MLAGTARAADGPPVAGISFEGNHTFADRVLLRWMTLRAPGLGTHSHLWPGELLSDLERLRRFYIGEGFLDVRLDGTVEEIGGEGVRLFIQVDEGKRWTLTECELHLAGAQATRALGDSLRRALTASGSGPYRLRALDTDRERLERILGSRGLLDADVRVLASRDDSCGLVRLRWSVDTGPRARYAGMRVYGLERVRESAVAREVAVRPGQLLRAADIELTRRNLLRTGLFPKVEVITAPRDSGRTEKHLVIVVREQPGGSVGGGVGYGTSDRARVLASFEHRNLDGRGLRLFARGVYGERRRGGEAELAFPWVLGHRFTLVFGGGHEWTAPPGWTAEMTRGSLHLARQVGARTRADFGYRLERQDLIKVRTEAATPGRTRIGTLSLGVTRDTRDDLRRPRSGSFLRMEQSWSTPWLGSFHDYARTDLERIRHRALGPLTFAVRSHLGWISRRSPGTSVPLNERYFAGGLRTIRGFPEDAVSPLDSHGVPRGGTMLATGSLETRISLFWKLSAAAFLDAGDVVDHAEAITWQSLTVGTGAGLLIDSPVGRVRAYLAFPVTARFQDGRQVYFTTGAAF